MSVLCTHIPLRSTRRRPAHCNLRTVFGGDIKEAVNYKLCLFLASPFAPTTGAPSALPTALTYPLPCSTYPSALCLADHGLPKGRDWCKGEAYPGMELCWMPSQDARGRGSWGLVTHSRSWGSGYPQPEAEALIVAFLSSGCPLPLPHVGAQAHHLHFLVRQGSLM